MKKDKEITRLIQWHNAIEDFNYDLVVDWAIKLIEKGHKSDNIFMLASFAKPVYKLDISPYINPVLEELNLNEKHSKQSPLAIAHFHIREILDGNSIRKNLEALYELCMKNNHQLDLNNFYLLYHSWYHLDSGSSYLAYYEGATKENINELLVKEANLWIDKNIKHER